MVCLTSALEIKKRVRELIKKKIILPLLYYFPMKIKLQLCVTAVKLKHILVMNSFRKKTQMQMARNYLRVFMMLSLGQNFFFSHLR